MKKLCLSLMLAVIMFIIMGCGKQESVSTITAKDTQFVMNYSILSSTKAHDMKLEKGAKINVAIENESGRVDILVTGANGEKIYQGDNASSGKFLLEIPKTDTYKFSVTGKEAKGSVSFIVAE